MFCPNCGQKLDDNVKFCQYCGTKLEGAIPAATEAVVSTPEEPVRGSEETAATQETPVTDAQTAASQEDPSSTAQAVENVYAPVAQPQQPNREHTGAQSEGTGNGILSGSFSFKDGDKINYDKLLALGSGIVGIFPVVMLALIIAFGFIIGLFSALSLRPVVAALSAIRNILVVVLMAAAAAVLGGTVYELVTGQKRAGQGMYVTIAASAISLLWGILNFVPGTAPVVFIMFVLLAVNLVLEVDLAAKLIVYGTALTGTFNLAASWGVLSQTWSDMRAKSAEANAQRTAAAGNGNGAASGSPAGNGEASYFDGTGGELFVKILLTALIGLITCGIATPWGLVMIYRWKAEHTVIGGKRQTFNGTGAELLGKWIIWEVLSLITCGLYGFYVTVALQKWEVSHTSYAGTPDNRNKEYPNSYFDGSFATYLGYSILCGFISMITCGIAAPWAQVPLLRWQYEGTVVERERYAYEGNGTGMFVIYIVNALLSLITCGLYSAWAICKINRYVISHVVVDTIERDNRA